MGCHASRKNDILKRLSFALKTSSVGGHNARNVCTIVVGEFDMFGEFDNREFLPHF